MSNGVLKGGLYGIILVGVILLIVWLICFLAGSDYNPFVHWWVAFPFIIIGVAGGFANRDG